jgi:hypothetical protein
VDLSSIGKLIVFFGLGLIVFGLLIIAAGKGIIPRLPGDISFQVGGVRVFLPIATSIVLSVILTVVISLFSRR